MEAQTFVSNAEHVIVDIIFKQIQARFTADPTHTIYTNINTQTHDFQLYLKTEVTEFSKKADQLQLHFKIDTRSSKIIIVNNFTEFTFDKEFAAAGIDEGDVVLSWQEEYEGDDGPVVNAV